MQRPCVVAAMVMMLGVASTSGRADHRRFLPKFTLDQITQVRTIGQFAISPEGPVWPARWPATTTPSR